MNTAVHFSSATDLWATPQDFFDKLNAEFDFTLDVCATTENAKCDTFYTAEDAHILPTLWRNWHDDAEDGAIWMNPPYGREIGKWVAKAKRESWDGATVVTLLPARTDTKWWHDHIWDETNHRPQKGVEVRFVRGRLKFGGSKNAAPFPSAVVIFRGKSDPPGVA